MAMTSTETLLGGANRHQSSVGDVSGLASCQVWEAGSGHCGESSKHLRKFRVGTLSVNTLRGRVWEVVETLSRRKVDVCCIQETRYRGGNCRIIKGKDTRYKLYWSGNDKSTAGVGVFVAEEWIEKVFEVQRVSDRILLVKLIVGQRVVTLLSVYAPQSGLSDVDKDLFFDQLRAVTARIPRSELLIPCGDWNGHVGRAGTEYREVHGGMGYGRSEPDVEGERILEYAVAFDLLLGNTCFKKRDSHLIRYNSGNAATQIDFILFPRAVRKLVTDVKVIPGEEVALQHQFFVCDMKFDVPQKPKRKFTPRLKVWKLTDAQRRNHFQEVFKLHVSASAGVPDAATEDIWNNLKKAFSRQLRRCVAQQGPTVGFMRPGGGMNMWERSLLPSGKLSRHGRLVKALEHHTMQPNTLPDVQCIMLAKKLTRRSTRILTQSLQNYTALQTSLEKRMPTL